MTITHEKWLRCKMDFICGKGSQREVAKLHGIGKSSVEKRAVIEGWSELRVEYEAAQIAKLFPSPPLSLPPVSVAPDGVVSSEWLAQRQELYFRENAALLDKARCLIEQKLANEINDPDSLTKLISALGEIADVENRLLGLNHPRKNKRNSEESKSDIPDV